ncbi:MAG: DUF4395 domain-containing protein [bacterium]|nr:DUF4395 domain-containing protein [bacterium]
MSKIIHFGEQIEGYVVPVLNEREVRTAAGILLLAAFASFMSAGYTGDFILMKIFITSFLIDFVIRVVVNPRYAPTLIIGRLLVRRQNVEYTGVAQKRFAWGLGLGLAATMFIVLVVNNIVGPVNLLLCLICLTLLFFESALGICIGCSLYNFFKKDKAQICPGGTCEEFKPEKIQNVSLLHASIAAMFIVLVVSLGVSGIFAKQTRTAANAQMINDNQSSVVDENCIVPDWAKNIGHEEQWKLHNRC